MTLSDYLKHKNLTYAAFAKLAGIEGKNPAMNVYRYASGKRLPRPEMADRIVKASNRQIKLSDIYGV